MDHLPFQGRKYCEYDFQTLFAPCCAKCKSFITGRVIRRVQDCSVWPFRLELFQLDDQLDFQKVLFSLTVNAIIWVYLLLLAVSWIYALICLLGWISINFRLSIAGDISKSFHSVSSNFFLSHLIDSLIRSIESPRFISLHWERNDEGVLPSWL